MDLSKLSDEDLLALSAGDVTKLSDEGLGILSGGTKRKTTLGEDIGIGLGQAGSTVAKGVGLLAGGAAGLFDEDLRDKIFKGTENIAKETQDYWTPKDAEQIFGGKVAGTVATLPMQMLAMPFSPADTGMTMIQQGEDVPTAQLGSLVDTLGNVAGVALPGAVGTGLATKAATGFGMNALQDYITRSVIQDISQTEGAKKVFEPTLESAALSGIVGGALGMLPTKGSPEVRATEETPIRQPTAEEGIPHTAQDSLDIRIDTLSRQRDALIEQWKEVKDIENPSEKQQAMIDSVREKLNDTVGQLNNLLKDTLEVKQEVPLEVEVAEKYQGKEQQSLENLGRRQEQLQKALGIIEENLQRKQNSSDPEDVLGVETLMDQKIQIQNRLKSMQDDAQTLQRYLEVNKQRIESLPPEQPKAPVEQAPAVETPRTRYTQAIESGDVMGALKEISTGSANQPIRVLAEAFLKKGFLKDVKIKIDKSLGTLGKFFYEDGSVALRSSSKDPHVFVHEILHRVTAGRLERYRRGERFDSRTNAAIDGLSKLHSFLTDNHAQSLRDAMGDKVANSVLNSMDELLAHGMTDIRFQAWLNGIEYKGRPAKRTFIDKLADFFGFNEKEKTALRKLYEVGEPIITHSRGELAPGKSLNAIDPTKDLGYDHNVDKVKSLLNLPNKFVKHAFTPTIPIMYRGHPIVDTVTNLVTKVMRKKETRGSDILGGSAGSGTYEGKVGKMFFPLSKLESRNGLIPAVKAVSRESFSNVADVLEAFREGMDTGRDYRGTLQQYDARWTPAQRDLARVLIRTMTKLLSYENELRTMVGLSNVPRKPGYFPAIRTGDHGLILSRQGTPYHIEYFVSKAQAMNKIKELKAQGIEAKYELKEGQEDISILSALQEIDARINQGNPYALQDAIQGAMDAQAGVTSRARARSGMPGYVGTEIGLSKEEVGKRFAHGVEGFVRQYLDSIAIREAIWERDNYYANNKAMVDDMPNAKEIADHYLDSVTGQFKGAEWVQKASKMFKEGIDNLRDFIPGSSKEKLESHTWDRFTGLAGSTFYKFALTQKFSMWLSQIATTLNAGRDFFEPGISMVDVYKSVGDAIKVLAEGKNVDKDFMEGMKYVSQSLHTFHPQLSNEFNAVRWVDNMPENAKKIFDIITGEKIMTSSDALSRFMVYNTFYHIYKRQGLRGKELWDKAATVADRNMYVYGKAYQPSMYKALGVVGEQMTPLKTFAHNQTGNLIADIKRAAQSQTPSEFKRSIGSLLYTATVLVAAGGVISAPVIAEYELLRKLAIAMGLDADKLPSAVEWALKQDPHLARGVISGETGIDMGASMRYHSLIEGVVDGNDLFKNLFPSIGFAKDMAVNTSKIVANAFTGDMPAEEVKHTKRAMLPKGWIGAGTQDILGLRDPNKVTMGKSGEMLMQGTPESKVAPYLGSRSVEEANRSDQMLINKAKDEKRREYLNKGVNFLLDGNGEKALEFLIKGDVDPNQLDNQALALLYKRDIPAFERYLTNKKGQISSFEKMRRTKENIDFLERR